MKHLLTIALLLLTFASCGESQHRSAIDLSFKTAEADFKASNQLVSVTVQGEWTLSLEFGNVGENWAMLSETSGSGPKKNVVLTWERNDTGRERSVDVVLESAGASVVRTFRQSGTSVKELKSDPVAGWMELPATDDPKLYFLTHPMTIGQTTTRNYSFYWDVDALVARWVAYPLNSRTIGSGSRSNSWGLDPKLPQDCQPVLYKGYKGGGPFERGHQCPSADRLTYSANVQTFYGTNMTPQIGDLNGGAWSLLENMVREWAHQLDTLYVVTGCMVTNSTEYAYDNEGKAVTVPTAYYKALLGYKKSGSVGVTGDTRGYTAIGFYFDHKSYHSDYNTVMEQSMTISELESVTGVDFFVNLPDVIGQSLSDKVHSTNDLWWK